MLILEDDDVFAQVLTRKLCSELSLQMSVTAVQTGDAALEAIQANHENSVFDALLVDLKLADDSGLRWIAPLRQLCPNARIIMMTAFASIATTVEAIKLGADDYLPKPFSLPQLLAAIQEPQIEVSEAVTKTNTAQTFNELDRMSLKRLEWEHIQRVLDEHNGNVSAAARELGLHRRTLQRKLQKKPHS